LYPTLALLEFGYMVYSWNFKTDKIRN